MDLGQNKKILFFTTEWEKFRNRVQVNTNSHGGVLLLCMLYNPHDN